MAAVPIQFNGLAFPPFPSFEKGTCPTLLDAAEAQKVKAFIENFLTRTNGRLVTGSPPGNRFSMTMTPGGNFLELWVQTDLKFDPAPLLSANLNTGGRVIFAPQRDLFLATSGAGAVMVQNTAGGGGVLKLGRGMPGTSGGGIGHSSNASPDGTIYLWPNDGTNGQVLTTDGSGNLSWGAGGGGGGTFNAESNANPSGAITIDDGETLKIIGGTGINGTADPSTKAITLAMKIAKFGIKGGTSNTAQYVDISDSTSDPSQFRVKGKDKYGTGIFVQSDATVMGTDGSGLPILDVPIYLSYEVPTLIDVGGSVVNGSSGDPNKIYLDAGSNISLSTSGGNRISIANTKTAIVDDGGDGSTFVELYCNESPEVFFEDVMELKTLGHGRIDAEIDPQFLAVCEPGTIRAVGHTTTEPAVAGIKIDGSVVRVSFSHTTPVPEAITIKLSGTRKGFAGRRFKKRSAEEARANDDFWGGWKK